MMARPPEYMNQHIAGSDEDMAMYVSDCRAELKDCIMQILAAIARAAYDGKDGPAHDFIERGAACYQRYFNSMKGATNLSADDVSSFIAAEMERQRGLQNGLKDLAAGFAGYGLQLEILPPGKVYSDPAWNIPLSICTTVRIDGRAYISAFCPRPATTFDYMAPRQDPVAARLIYMDDKMMCFMQHDQDVGEAFAAACSTLWGEPTDITADFGGAWAAQVSGGVLLLDTGESVSDEEIGRLTGKYGVSGLIAANSSSFKARLYVAGYDTSRLEYEIGD